MSDQLQRCSSSQKGGESPKQENDDVTMRLSGELRMLMGGRQYAKQSELTREMLLRYAADKGDVVPVELFEVEIQNLEGREFTVTMEVGQKDAVAEMDDDNTGNKADNTVKSLKRKIEEVEGTSRWQQQLFLADTGEDPLEDCDRIDGSSPVLLYVAGAII
jgi:hypothetical protein